jgi:hypothetical protein
MSAVISTLAPAGDGALCAELSDACWRLVWCHGDDRRELVAVDPRQSAAQLLNRDLREAPGAPRPDTKEATAERIAQTTARWAGLPAGAKR